MAVVKWRQVGGGICDCGKVAAYRGILPPFQDAKILDKYDRLAENIGEMLNLENFPHVKKVCMIKNGQMIFEHTRENEKGTLLFPVGCIFKSFLSVLVGIALYEGKIGSIDDCVIADRIIDTLLDTREFSFPSAEELDAFEKGSSHPDGKRWCVAEQTIGNYYWNSHFIIRDLDILRKFGRLDFAFPVLA